ncbi:hypothetical protein [Sedimenticola selenatireducens]|jgi:hypothetical protein|uniref:Uncharacterized protein n=1 Tax=Sedimenticola selenatireducens TaxID=191960 RepID=A0A558DM41_9GAMM|nr:hypothetical protein [Sedimenticola selenatireducens]TVO78733.1 hypothetical protein FHP88_00820 [Sedimenticola selenatireducens]TVT62095.1 MAG: hypothetical protein FHK78_15935 [Sedimenticola selenatireducens]
MKHLLITALISLVSIGTATADINSDLNVDQVYGSTVNSGNNFTSLPATAAGRTSEASEQGKFGGMQDHPSDRVSGI